MFVNKAIRFFKGGLVVMQAVAIGFAIWETYKQTQAHKIKKPDMKKKFKDNRDIIDETSWESFPASDAPASNRFT